ncbi:hypothetical protein F5X98DRAFT_297564 [Xylaria grammica]|nr:hypothetical protein F5X98DRAFT_297564 [Xylaria grammica]
MSDAMNCPDDPRRIQDYRIMAQDKTVSEHESLEAQAIHAQMRPEIVILMDAMRQGHLVPFRPPTSCGASSTRAVIIITSHFSCEPVNVCSLHQRAAWPTCLLAQPSPRDLQSVLLLASNTYSKTLLLEESIFLQICHEAGNRFDLHPKCLALTAILAKMILVVEVRMRYTHTSRYKVLMSRAHGGGNAQRLTETLATRSMDCLSPRS